MRWLLSGFVGLSLLCCAAHRASAQAAPSVDSTTALAAAPNVVGERAAVPRPPIHSDSRPEDLSPESPSKTPQARPAAHELFTSEAAELDLALGRLQLNGRRFRVMRKHESLPDGCERSCQVSVHEGAPSLRVLYRDAAEEWSLQSDSSGTTWTRRFDADGQIVNIAYNQRPNQLIVIEVAVGESAKPVRLTGPSLWHMVRAADPVFVQYVKPSVTRLKPNWNPDETVQAATRLMETSAALHAEHPKVVTARCLKELESSESARRLDAAAALRGLGLAGQIPLTEAAAGKLTPHQRETVDRLLGTLQPHSPDTATRLAYWLSGDSNWR